MSETKTGRGALFTGGVAAILASACCVESWCCWQAFPQ